MIEFIVDEFEIEYQDGFAVKIYEIDSDDFIEIRLSTLRELLRELDQEIKEAGDEKTG